MPNGIYKYIIVLAIILQTFSTNSLAEPIPQTGWSLLSVDSQELVGESGAAVNAFDGNVNTHWATNYVGSSPTPPYDIHIALNSSYELTGFHYLPRQDGSDNGRIDQ